MELLKIPHDAINKAISKTAKFLELNISILLKDWVR
jgi:hypothetical protein